MHRRCETGIADAGIAGLTVSPVTMNEWPTKNYNNIAVVFQAKPIMAPFNDWPFYVCLRLSLTFCNTVDPPPFIKTLKTNILLAVATLYAFSTFQYMQDPLASISLKRRAIATMIGSLHTHTSV